MRIIGIILIILAFLVAFFGGVGITIYSLYDIIVNWDTLTKVDVFWDIVIILLRDVVTFTISAVLFLGGMVLKKD